ncbi:MAG: cbb3-type cytochrome c oxidase subunit [Cyanobacteria bacterium RYN_339]|nr:cbb3-type cytochrome c oxidase subunit [Cyanobacteria bacterium RYN_339]
MSLTLQAPPVTAPPTYNDTIVKHFTAMAVVYAIVGMLVGVYLAAELAFPSLNFGLPWLSFGRLRPLHTNAVIYAFGGCTLFACMYYSVQRTCRVRLWGDKLVAFTFWGWNAIIVAAVITLPLGLSQAKEYAELEWPIDLAIAVVWVAVTVVFVMTLVKRREPHIYVSNWFFLAMMIGVAMLHIINNLAYPVSWGKSYSAYAGMQDGMVQWWFGHNAVGFVLTAGFLGVMYYFLPKQAQRPIYSYRLSVVHFWSLVFIYIWAGPHHLLYSPLPDWAQNLGMVFSVALIVPSWGGSFNGIMTLRGAWGKLRTDPILKFMLTAMAFYAMCTTEGSLLSVRSVNSLSHFTDWTIAHVHSGALGWVTMISVGAIYHLWPRLVDRPLYSLKLVNWHFWISTIGTVLYISSLWIAGIMQGLMWRQLKDDGSLAYSFVQTMAAMHPYYLVRLVGGGLFLAGMVLMAYNLVRTSYQAVSEDLAHAA